MGDGRWGVPGPTPRRGSDEPSPRGRVHSKPHIDRCAFVGSCWQYSVNAILTSIDVWSFRMLAVLCQRHILVCASIIAVLALFNQYLKEVRNPPTAMASYEEISGLFSRWYRKVSVCLERLEGRVPVGDVVLSNCPWDLEFTLGSIRTALAECPDFVGAFGVDDWHQSPLFVRLREACEMDIREHLWEAHYSRYEEEGEDFIYHTEYAEHIVV